MKVWIHLLINIIIVQTALTQDARQKKLMDQDWKFHFGHGAIPEKDFNYGLNTIFSKSGGAFGTAIDPRFNDSLWRSLDLPHDWAVELPFSNKNDFGVSVHGYKPVGGYFPETSIGWYRKKFALNKQDTAKRYTLQFDGVFRDATVWVNGFYLGNNKSGYMGVTYDITDFVWFDRPNTIVVRVDATQYEGWFYEGAGIYRHVWLNQFEPVHIADEGTFIYSNTTGTNTKISFETPVENNKHTDANYKLIHSVLDREGNLIIKTIESTGTLTSDENRPIKQTVSISGAHLWSLEDPYLYRIVTELYTNNQLTDRQVKRFGIRTIEIKPNGFFLNGKSIKLFGVNCHQDHAGLGSALPDYMQYYRTRLLKNMGVNAYRTSHNPPTPELLDACDSLGMLVLDEQRLLNSSPEYLDQFERLIKRDRSRTCVFLWSIGNEEGWIHTTPTGKKIAETFIAKQKLWDPSRTCTYAADLPNTFKGVNEVIPVRSFNYRQFAVADYHRDHPNQPIIGTEMGSTVTTRGILEKDSIRAYLPDQDITAPWWASTAEEWWKLAAVNDFWLGGFVWTGFDYRGEPTPFEWPNINSHFGIMDMCGFPKNIYYYYQSWWTDKDVLHISPHWNLPDKRPTWPSTQGKPVEVWVNTNADDVELFLNGKSLGKKVMPRNSHLNWTVNYEPGVLEAVANKKGKILKTKVETTGPASEIVLQPYKTTMVADGKDIAIINILAMDREGREVPDADNLVHFSILGGGKIIGVGNGDPSSHEPDKCVEGAWERRLFSGRCQVIIQAGTNGAPIKFEAKAIGLFTGSTDIVTILPAQITKVSTDPIYTVKNTPVKNISKMIGADISFLPQLEDRGIKFSDNGIEKDAIQIMKDHGFNYVRLRIFNEPARDSGYAPGKGYCDLAYTKKMALRVKAAGMKLLLDFHYSDYWADPGKQYKPFAWKGQSFEELKKSLYDFTFRVMSELKAQGTMPDMVQVGNEINHGLVWPEGNVNNPDQMAQLILAGTAAVKAVNPNAILLLHLALGGQFDECSLILDQMVSRGVVFDIIGLSYYPKWHCSLDDLRDNMNDLIRKYNKDVIVVEYSAKKEEINKLVFDLPGGKGKGTCIWEPLSTWEMIFDRQGKSNDLIKLYDGFQKNYLTTK
ncbi:MAG: beta-galactosidase GalA [Saprospiraceae bacterium]